MKDFMVDNWVCWKPSLELWRGVTEYWRDVVVDDVEILWEEATCRSFKEFPVDSRTPWRTRFGFLMLSNLS
jgi:hypothetical protein